MSGHADRIDGIQTQLWTLERQRKPGLHDVVLEGKITSLQHQLAMLRIENRPSLREQLPVPSSTQNWLNE